MDKAKTMDRAEIEAKTFEVFDSGFCCAESISKVVLEALGAEHTPAMTRLASGFIGGIGRTKEDVCGGLVGGVMVLGFLYGRSQPGQNVDELCKKAGIFREQFTALQGSTLCPVILERLGEQEGMVKCKRFIAEAAGILIELLAEETA